MPQTINGIGTRYCGKGNLRKRPGVCDSCGVLADLSSYDTERKILSTSRCLVLISTLVIVLTQACSTQANVAERKAWEMLALRDASEVELKSALQVIRGTPSVEVPEKWTALIQDSALKDGHRAMLFFEFFRRHVILPSQLGTLVSINGTREWLAENCVHDMTSASKLPPGIDRENQGCVFMIQPGFLSSINAALYIQVRESILKREFLEAVTHPDTGPVVTIVAQAPSNEP